MFLLFKFCDTRLEAPLNMITLTTGNTWLGSTEQRISLNKTTSAEIQTCIIVFISPDDVLIVKNIYRDSLILYFVKHNHVI